MKNFKTLITSWIYTMKNSNVIFFDTISKTFQAHFGVSRFTLEWLHCLHWKITVSTENKIPPIINFMYNQCTLKINWCTLKINQSIKYLHTYQCTLLLDISVHWKLILTNYQLDVWLVERKPVYLFTLIFKNQCICSHWFSTTGVHWKQTGVHWKLTGQSNQCTPVFENQCICSQRFSKTGVHWKQNGVHWNLTSQWNQCTPVCESQCISSHWFSKPGVHWKQTGVHWKLTSQWNQCTLIWYHWKLSRQSNQCTLISFQCTPKNLE